MKKRLLAFSIAWMLTLSLIPTFPSTAFAKTYSKNCVVGERYYLDADNPGSVKGYAWYSPEADLIWVLSQQ